MGDMNVYYSSESAFQTLVTETQSGVRFFDPINKSGIGIITRPMRNTTPSQPIQAMIIHALPAEEWMTVLTLSCN